MDLEEEYLLIGKKRKLEIENQVVQRQFRERINGFGNRQEMLKILLEENQSI